MSVRPALFLGIVFCLSSCKMYRSHFDCCPGQGIPCTSVTDIESMVIELQEGPDVLAGSNTGAWKNLIPPPIAGQTRKVWIADEDTGCGCLIEGHYIYIQPRSTDD